MDSHLWTLALKYSYYLLPIYIVWSAFSWAYNLYLHPLARFPGPRMAAMTGWWKVWMYMVSQDSIPRMFKLHAQYGDVVRIAPNELHFSNPDAYGDIYHPTRRWLKEENLYGSMIDGNSTFTLLDYPSAKKRRDVLLNHFSRKSIIELQHLVQERLDILCTAIQLQHARGKPSDFYHAFKCFSLDTITSVCFAKPMEATHAPDFKSDIVIAMDASIPTLMAFVLFPLFRSIFSKIPASALVAWNKTLKGYFHMRKILEQQIRDILADPSMLTSAPHPIIYHSLLNSNEKTGESLALSFNDLSEEAFLLVFAGTDTASNTMTAGILHCIENRRIYDTLKEELMKAWPDLEVKPLFESLERLPYLTAVVKESLRLSHGVVSPLVRIVPPEGAIIGGHTVPGGTIVGMSSCFVHLNESKFPDAWAFKPERWLEPGANELDPYLVPFSKGPRSCVGVNLGYCELYLAFANILRRFDLELHGVSTSDLKWRDVYLPLHLGPDMNVFATPVSS